MKVLYFAELFWPHVGGVEILSDRLIRSMIKEKNHEFYVITNNINGKYLAQERVNNINIYRFPFAEALERFNLPLISSIHKNIIHLKQKINPDMIHFNSAQGAIGYFYINLQKNNRIPALVTIHGAYEQQLAADKMAKIILSDAAHVVCVSNAVRQDVLNAIPDISSKISVIANGLPLPNVQSLPLVTEPFTFLCLGRLVNTKGFDLALKAFAKVFNEFRSIRLIIAGDGPERVNLERLAEGLGINRAVEFTGWILSDEVHNVINRSAVMLMPSLSEGCPLVALEAAQMSRSIIASKIDSLAELIKHDINGLLFEPGNISQFVLALKQMITNKGKAAILGKNMRDTVMEKHDWNKLVNTYDFLYKKLAVKVNHESN